MRRIILPGLIAGLVLIAGGPAFADGFIIVPPHRPDRPEVRNVPLAVKYHRVKTTIKDQVAVTEIDQVFVNPNAWELEGTYIFPIPEGAAISAFSMFIDGKEMKGELIEKDKARKIYEDIVRSMRDPALLEYAGREMFKASIFPIPARGEKRVKISYEEICRADGGMVRYRYPLNTEKFSSRPLEDVSVVIEISGEQPIKNITCPTHPVEVVTLGETSARVAFEAKNVTPDRDLVLYYSISDAKFALNLLAHRPKADEDGYFLLLLSPGKDVGEPMPKDVCFVMDVSGSMMGRKMDQARAALRFCVQALNPADRFEIVPFSTEAKSFTGGLVEATGANKERALKFIDGLSAMGGTATHEALMKAMALTPTSDRPYLVVFVTDGLSTIGETKEEVILRDVAAKTKSNVRLFAFGVGDDVNTHLLDKLAEQNRGSRDYVAESEDLELKISNFFEKVSYPVLSDVSLAFSGVTIAENYPKRLPDLFRGSQIAVVGRYSGDGPSAVTLTGKLSGQTHTVVDEETFPAKTADNEFLPRLWAIRKIGFLLDELRLRGENEELKNEVVRLARLYGVVTPYTSFLVLEDQAREPTVRLGLPGPAGRTGAERGDAGAPPPAGAAAPGAPARDAFDDYDAEDRRAAAEGLGGATGGAAVSASRAAQELKGEAPGSTRHGYVPEAGREKAKRVMQLVEGRAFYKSGEIWVQAELPEKAERKTLELFSEEYFRLLDKHPETGKFLALGKVDFLIDGVVYQVR